MAFHLQDKLVQVLACTKALLAMPMLTSLCEPVGVNQPAEGHGGNEGAGKGYRKRQIVDGCRYYLEETLRQSQREEWGTPK